MDNNSTTHNTSVRRVPYMRKGPAALNDTVFIAECSCGWASRKQWSRPAADREATDHVVYMKTYVED